VATFITYTYGGTNDLVVLNGAQGTADGTSVTFTDPGYLPGFVLTLTGTGITGTPDASWNITSITGTYKGTLSWAITGLVGIDGAPTSGAFDSHSIFQALAFHNIGDLLLGGPSTLISSPIASRNWLYGHGNNDILQARGGDTVLDGGGGFDILISATHGHTFFKFDSDLDNTYDTIRGFSPARDTIELDRGPFDIGHLGYLKASEFHSGLGTPGMTGADIIYNQGNGRLFYDDNGTHPGGLHLFAVVGVAGHPALTAADFLVIA
jgi:Ca2+-binding RTX toxin-like protein